MHKRILVLLLWMSASLLYSMVSYASSPAPFKVAIEADDVVSRVLFDAISDDLNVSIEYVTYPSFDEILSAVASKQADFAANVTYTDSRALLFDFSSPTNIEYTYLYSLNNATLRDVNVVGVPKDTIYGSLIRQHYPTSSKLSIRDTIMASGY
nr:transporter substrate-binding domain-containing protein [Vibrio mexicanus]